MILFELWFSQGICSVVGLLGHTVVLVLVPLSIFKSDFFLFVIELYEF